MGGDLYRVMSRVFVLLVGVGLLTLLGCSGGGDGAPCTDGQVVGCTCGSQAGAQVCSGGGWTACNCAQGCAAGTTVACTCGSSTGSQTCNSGTWGACNCAAGGCQAGQTLPCSTLSGGRATFSRPVSGSSVSVTFFPASAEKRQIAWP